MLQYQHGFLKKKSVVSNLLQTKDDWTKSSNNGKSVDVLYLHFSRAFNKVPLHRLLHKLKHFEIRGKLLRWISGFLRDRRSRLRFGSVGQRTYVLNAVPQGFVLGPILFLIYELTTHDCKSSVVLHRRLKIV